MLTFKQFAGINNVLPQHRLGDSDLTVATNVDIGLTGDITRRAGYTEASALCHKNIWQADGFMLATVDGNDLVTVGGGVVASSVGTARVWYCNLPDGRVAFSNGSLCGIASEAGSTKWGVPRPAGVGALSEVAGDLFAGEYQYAISHVRLADGLEGAPLRSAVTPLSTGGVVLMGLPLLDDHKTNVYITSHNGADLYLAGSTTNSTFAFSGANKDLVVPCRTEFLEPAPAGRCLSFWRGRALVADGRVLRASLPNRWEHFDPRKDFKQFSADITLIVGVDDGVYVGTERELAFLAGTDFGGLVYSRKIAGRVVLGSGVSAPGELIKAGNGVGSGSAMLGIVAGEIVAGFNSGAIVRLTHGRYQTDATEVAATFRELRGIPQYLAVPQ